MNKYSLLYIDDEKHNLTAFKAVFGDDFRVFTAINTAEAFRILEENRVHLIIADQRMPEETGVQFLARVRKEFPNTVRTILTGYSDITAVIDAINSSHIYYYFKKPWREEELKLVCFNAIEALELSQSNVNLARDLSEALEQLRNKARELEEQVEYRQELIDRLDRANRVKAEFLSVISHELRTPLNPIIGYSDLMIRETEDESQKSYLSVINRCGNDLLRLIDGILEFLEVERANLEHQKEPISMAVLLKDLEMVAGNSLKDNPEVRVSTAMKVEGRGGEAFPELIGELMTIRQIMHNLVSNACKFTEKGSIRIEAELVSKDGEHLLRMSVADTGIGIAEKDFESIFEAFTQLDQALSRKFDGLGLGLALCKRLAGMLKGRIWLESELGKGSVFTLEIPILIGSKAEPTVDKVSFPATGLRGLVVDDNEQNRLVLGAMLDRLSCSNDLMSDGEDALSAVAQGDYDILFIDLLMPGIDGFELARRVGQMGLKKRPRLVAVTADLSTRAKARAKESGIEEMLYKPVDFEALARLVSPVEE